MKLVTVHRLGFVLERSTSADEILAGVGVVSADHPVVERRVRTYLADQARNGQVFVKSGRVAEDLELGTERAGQAIAKLEAECPTLEIDRWSERGNSGGITWHVTNAGPTPYGRDCQCGRLLPEPSADCPHCGRRVE